MVTAKKSEWDIQGDVRKAAKEWVQETNNNHVARMLQENTGLIITPHSRKANTSTNTNAEDG